MEDVLIYLQIMPKGNLLKPPIRNLHKYKNTTTLKSNAMLKLRKFPIIVVGAN